MRRADGQTDRRTVGSALIIVVLGWLSVSPLIGQTAPVRPSVRLSVRPSAPGDELTISLMTMGVGAEVWERFGHNAIIVEDKKQGTAIAYNYGMFSFRQENFVLRFIQGRMDYWMAAQDAEDELPRYREARRSVWKQELNLTAEQKVQLRDFLLWNALPENRFYHYDYYRDNCSTRVRDALDRVLGGAIQAQSGGPASGNYRFHTLRLVAANRPLYLGLALIEGQPVDRPSTKWDEMFLPLKLREYISQVMVTDSAGNRIPLVKNEETLYQSSAYPVPETPPRWLLPLFVLGALLGGLFFWGGARGRQNPFARYVVSILGGFWALLTGVGGVIMAGMWAFTDHAVAASNENVLQCSVAALILAIALPFAMGDRPWALKTARVFAILIGALSVLGLVLKVLPGFYQANWPVLALFVPANLGLMGGVLAWTKQNA